MIAPMRVFVLLFNARTENEGIHTIQTGDRNSSELTTQLTNLNSEIVQKTAELEQLNAQVKALGEEELLAVQAMDAEEIKDFCDSAGYDWEVVPEGALALPPEINIEQTDWQLDDEDKPLVEEKSDSDMSDTELDSIKRRLEGLL